MTEDRLTPLQIQAFARHLRLEEKSEATMEKYLRDIRAFARWLDGREISKGLSAAWKAHLVERGYAPASINAKLSALNNLLEFLGLGGCRVKFLRVQRRLFRDAGRELTKAEYQRLLDTAHRLGQERLGLLVEAMGPRASGSARCGISRWRPPGRARPRSPSRARSAPSYCRESSCRKLLQYAQKQKTASGAIFRTKSGKELGRRQIWAEMKRLCGHAGVDPRKVFPHNLRHLFAMVFYRTSRDIVKLADLLGHSSIETTRIYLVTSGAEHQRTLDRLGLIS